MKNLKPILSMQEVMEFLKFTTEIEADFETEWLPTLDMELKMEGTQVMHRFYEKPTTARVTVQERSAMEENTKMKVLGNDLMRRLLNSKVELGEKERNRIVDGY